MKAMQIPASLFLALLLSSHAALAASPDMCKIQREASARTPPAPDKVLPMRELTKQQEGSLVEKRACLKSYANQFSEDLDTFLKAPSADLRSNLETLRSYFDRKRTVTPLTEEDRLRKLYIDRGWDREQVILWGSLFLIRASYREGELDAVISESARLRQEFGLSAAKIESWDKVQNATYFSTQALKNMILGLEYMARIRKPGTSVQDAKLIRSDYLRDRDAIAPFAKYVDNPDSIMFRAICRGK